MRAYWLALLLPLSLAAQADDRVKERILDNGLKVIIKEDHRAPIVTSQVWYRVGSSYENGGSTGISHVLEHMMFKGTAQHPPGEFSRIVSANGGDENAFTNRDYTAYFQNLAKDRLPVSFELEADRMRNASLPPEEFAKEIQVVKEERRMRTEDDPEAMTVERFHATAFDVSPYHHPVIGWMGDLDSMTAQDVRDWYRQWYAPNNAILVVVGDVDPNQVMALAQQHFGPLKPEKIQPPKPRAEPEQLGTKRLVVKAPAQEPYLLMGYKTPVIGTGEDWEPYALEMLTEILDGGSSSRLSRKLVRGTEVASAINAGYDAFDLRPGLLELEANAAQGRDIAQVEQAIRQEIEALKTEPVTAAELERVRNRVIAAKVFERDSVYYQAMQIGMLEATGRDWRLADQYVDKISAITAEQVQAVAKKYLTDDRLTVAVLDPQPMPDTPRRRASAGGYHGIR